MKHRWVPEGCTIVCGLVWLVMALAVCWDAASALRKHRNRKS
ncbi:hypothetical protein [Dysosmobacter sp.]|nr:hypothetical protein [Dysosmobacter sp.]